MKTEYFKIPSIDSVHQLNCKLYVPTGTPKGIFQLVHGMTEHIERYDAFLSQICEAGYICVAHDHLGHGKTVNDDTELGFIAKENGWLYLVEDTHRVSEHIKNLNPELPLYLLGHSMGSFVVRLYAQRFKNELSGLIIMGTGGKNPAGKVGLLLTKIIAKLKGKRHISNLIYSVAFGGYTKRFDEPTPHSWLSSDITVAEKYARDKYCTFRFCVQAMNDLITLNVKSNEKKHFDVFDKNVPVLLVSGAMDPVGDYSKGVLYVEDMLKKREVSSVSCKIYENARHEILNDFCKQEVISDIIDFISRLDKSPTKE